MINIYLQDVSTEMPISSEIILQRLLIMYFQNKNIHIKFAMHGSYYMYHKH